MGYPTTYGQTKTHTHEYLYIFKTLRHIIGYPEPRYIMYTGMNRIKRGCDGRYFTIRILPVGNRNLTSHAQSLQCALIHFGQMLYVKCQTTILHNRKLN